MKINNRFGDGQSKARTIRMTRLVSAFKPFKQLINIITELIFKTILLTIATKKDMITSNLIVYMLNKRFSSVVG